MLILSLTVKLFYSPSCSCFNVIFTPQACPDSRRPNGNLMGSLPGSSLVFCSLSLWICSGPFPGPPLAERDAKVLAAPNNVSPSGSWVAACLPPYQVQMTARCCHCSQVRLTCNHHCHLLFPPANLGPEPQSLGSHSFFFSANVILCPTRLSGFACSATPFLNQAEFLGG